MFDRVCYREIQIYTTGVCSHSKLPNLQFGFQEFSPTRRGYETLSKYGGTDKLP